jgi:hypothetical protein
VSALQRLLALVLSGKQSGLLVSNAILVFARLLLQHQHAFEQLLGSAAAAAGIQPQQQQQQHGGSSSPEGLLLALVGVLCDAFDSIAQPLARKLAACCLAALLAFPVEVRLLAAHCVFWCLASHPAIAAQLHIDCAAKWYGTAQPLGH